MLLVSGDRHHAEALREQVAAVIAPIGLRLAPEKTRVVHIDEGFDFLGFHIRRRRKRGTHKHYVYTTPSRTRYRRPGTGYGRRPQINPQQRPGRADHQPEPDSAGMGELLSARGVQAGVQHHRPPRLVADRGMDPREIPGQDQPQNQLRRRFCGPGWRIAHNGVVFTGASSVAVTRYRHRGANIPTPWTPTANSG